MSKETPDEMFERVQMMAGGNPAWDLSENDIAALNHVLSTLHDVASEADPAGTLRDLRQAQDTINALEDEIAEVRSQLNICAEVEAHRKELIAEVLRLKEERK